jgi:MYXO-CTERM domain-containing protein
MLLASGGASAQGTFTPGAGTSVNCDLGTTYLASKDCSVGVATATMTAWGYTGTLSGSTAAAGFTRGLLADWNTSGAGVVSGNLEGASPHHAFDSITAGCSGSVAATGGVTPSNANSGCGGSIEGMLMNFNRAVSLTSVGIGWNGGGDSDLSVWRWTGVGAAPTSLTGTNASGSDTTSETFAAALSGWTLVSNHNMVVGVEQGTGNTLFSSAFLITTYFGASNSTLHLDAGNDRFKLNRITVGICTGTVGSGGACTPGTVSAPGTLALAGLGLLGAAFLRRRNA